MMNRFTFAFLAIYFCVTNKYTVADPDYEIVPRNTFKDAFEFDQEPFKTYKTNLKEYKDSKSISKKKYREIYQEFQDTLDYYNLYEKQYNSISDTCMYYTQQFKLLGKTPLELKDACLDEPLNLRCAFYPTGPKNCVINKKYDSPSMLAPEIPIENENAPLKEYMDAKFICNNINKIPYIPYRKQFCEYTLLPVITTSQCGWNTRQNSCATRISKPPPTVTPGNPCEEITRDIMDGNVANKQSECEAETDKCKWITPAGSPGAQGYCIKVPK